MLDGSTLFRDLLDARGLVLAVSGGPDSTALMYLAAAWRPPGMPVWVASVDHGLQDGSRQVAEGVVARASALGLPGRVLAWTGEKPAHGIQARARDARYALLEEVCREVDASHIVLAHTLDDQAETVLMRLAAGSGLRGLAGMRAITARQALTLARPLLTTRKDQLRAACVREGWSFVDDTANRNERFARPRLRRAAQVLAAEGLTPERMGRLAERAARADAALAGMAAQVARSATRTADAGTLVFDAAAVLSAHDEVALRVLAGALEQLRPDVPLRLHRLEGLLEHLRGGARHRTVQGCLVRLSADGSLLVTIEPVRHRGRAAGVAAA